MDNFQPLSLFTALTVLNHPFLFFDLGSSCDYIFGYVCTHNVPNYFQELKLSAFISNEDIYTSSSLKQYIGGYPIAIHKEVFKLLYFEKLPEASYINFNSLNKCQDFFNSNEKPILQALDSLADNPNSKVIDITNSLRLFEKSIFLRR